ncbi:hypothetical protein PMNALOAF_0156 [Methylobacterium adhaesivum]|nr:hypothetical protein PMNALOAF_0156 [Methylobacterium adhaesivum]
MRSRRVSAKAEKGSDITVNASTARGARTQSGQGGLPGGDGKAGSLMKPGTHPQL